MMFWKSARFKGQDVFVQTDESGAPVTKKGLVPMKYSIDGGKTYSASEKNLDIGDGEIVYRPTEEQGPTQATPKKTQKGVKAPPSPRPGSIVIYTDGACSGNPGPAGFGVFVENGPRPAEISGFLGDATNNIAELEAIGAALEWVESESCPIDLYTDSSYSIGVLTKGWKAKANQTLIARIRRQVKACIGLQLHWVKGHAGLPGNEKADELARKAIETSSSDTMLLSESGGEQKVLGEA